MENGWSWKFHIWYISHTSQGQLEQLERLCSEDTPRRLMITHTIGSYWIPSQEEDKVKVTNSKNLPKFHYTHYTQHTFRSCLISCANMKWIQWVLLKIQSTHDSVHRRTDRGTDGQGETSIPPFQLRWIGGYNDISCSGQPVYWWLTSRMRYVAIGSLVTTGAKQYQYWCALWCPTESC